MTEPTLTVALTPTEIATLIEAIYEAHGGSTLIGHADAAIVHKLQQAR